MFTNSSPITPHFALVFHGHEPSSCNTVTQHPIKNGELGVGDFVAPESVFDSVKDALADTVRGKATILPANVLVDSSHELIWYRKSEVRDVFTNINGRGKRLKVKLPTLIFRASKRNRSIYITASASSARPTKDTRLYIPPVFNVNGLGGLCLGDAKLPDSISVHTIDEMENAFYGYNGTHINCSDVLKGGATTAGLFNFLKGKSDRQERIYAKEMTPFRTLGEWL